MRMRSALERMTKSTGGCFGLHQSWYRGWSSKSSKKPPPQGPPYSSRPDASSDNEDNPSRHRYVLFRFHGESSTGASSLRIVDSSLIHNFDWRQPLRDYLIPRQNPNGVIDYWPGQVVKTAQTRKQLDLAKDEPINREKRVVLKKKRCSELFDQLIKRDGPIGRAESSEAASDDESQDDSKKRKCGKIQKNAAKASPKKKNKKVPPVNNVDPADLEILQHQAREMPGLSLSPDDDSETQDLKIRLILAENARVEARAKLD
ncbi:hypothetical protein QAD02_021239 [Eretmocerus hayati]|uniref:Uncharacterized protein n=1 Tax=Eretmocerus hayati TaxID=131215 RepID=A0ACC2PPM5_9HYME|nr:hypothetical protein QAD02_021239 [Eretmocerus hayati]